MHGFSVYLGDSLDDSQVAYMKRMRQAGFTGVFTSLHIPEDDASALTTRLQRLVEVCKQLDLELVADISTDGFKRLGIAVDNYAAIKNFGVTGLRVDYGFTNAQVAALSRALPIALNASTITAQDVAELHAANADFSQLEAWHNFYPRPETGLDARWYAAKNEWLHAQNMTTMAFVPGDGQLRGPLYAGLPTLEAHRFVAPLAAALDLARMGTDRIYVGDNQLGLRSQRDFADYLADGTLTMQLEADVPALTQRAWHNRPDVARDVVRLREGREVGGLLPTTPLPARPRVVGTVTVDNNHYGRYAGELQIVSRELPADAKVNVLGRVDAASRALLPFIDANQAIVFKTPTK